MKAAYSNDTKKGPGHGFLRISDDAFGNSEGLRFSVKRGSDQNFLAPGGWQPSESLMPAQHVALADAGFSIAVGPEVVDHLDTQENYRLSLVRADGTRAVGALRVPEIAYSPVAGGQGIGATLAAVPPPPPPPPPTAPEQESTPRETEASMELLPPPGPAPAPRKGGAAAPIIMTALLLALAGGAFVAWKFFFNADGTTPLTAQSPPPKEESTAPTAPQSPPPTAPESSQADENRSPQTEDKGNTPAKEASPPPQPPLARAREHLAGPADPAQGVTLAKSLRLEREGLDAAFLLLEDAAQKGDSEAMLLTGGYFDPADPAPSGSIHKDPAAALAWYAKAKAAGHPLADARLAALRAWAQAEAARGSRDAAQLLRQF